MAFTCRTSNLRLGTNFGQGFNGILKILISKKKIYIYTSGHCSRLFSELTYSVLSPVQVIFRSELRKIYDMSKSTLKFHDICAHDITKLIKYSTHVWISRRPDTVNAGTPKVMKTKLGPHKRSLPASTKLLNSNTIKPSPK